MRLAYLCADRGIPLWGNKGASVHVRSVSEALVERGHQVDVVAVRTGEERSVRFRPSVIEIPYDRTLKRLRRSIEGDTNEVLSNEIYSLLLNTACHDGLLEAERRGRLDGIYERYSLWSTAGLRFARARGIPFVLEINAPLALEQAMYRDLELREAAEGIERFLFQEADSVFVPSQELADFLQQRLGAPRRIHVTPNGVNASSFLGPHPLADEPIVSPKGPFTIAFLGSLKPWHGIGVLLRAFKNLRSAEPEVKLLVIGDGPLRGEVEALVADLGDRAVQWTGEVPHEAIPDYLRLADVGVAPYPELDPFYFSPMKVIEYMAGGLPVVASSIGQLDSLVENGSTGVLVRPGDAEELARALAALARDRRTCRRMGRRAQRRALRRYTWDGVAERIESVFENLSDKTVRDLADTTVSEVAGASGGGS